jgi:hypothetical protein
MNAGGGVGLVACCQSKLRVPAPACDLYTSPLFRAARNYAEWRYGHERWFILSAKYGFVDPSTVLEPYDFSLRQLSAAARAAWSRRVGDELAERFAATTVLWIHAGAAYCQAVRHAATHPIETPVAGLRIGQQLAWYRHHRLPGS